MKVIRDPFSCRNDLNVRAQYKALKSLNLLTIRDSDRILIKELGPDFPMFVNETPHLFFNSIKHNQIFFKTPAHMLLNPEDYKCGDLVSLTGSSNSVGEIIECKTFERLTNSKVAEIYTQYRFSQNVGSVNFSILYDKEVLSEKEFTKILCANAQIDPQKVFFINLKQLGLASSLDNNIQQFFQFYKNLKYCEYVQKLITLRELLANEVLLNTSNLAVKRGLKKYIENLNKRDKLNFPKIPKGLKNFKTNEEEELPIILSNSSDSDFTGGE